MPCSASTMVVCGFKLPVPPVAAMAVARRHRQLQSQVQVPEEAKLRGQHGRFSILQSVDETNLKRGFITITKKYLCVAFFFSCVLQDIAPLLLVRLYPHTGLKHQLRVHMAHALRGTLVLIQPLETV